MSSSKKPFSPLSLIHISLIAAGATPLLIPVDRDAGRAAEYLPLLDGLLVPGGEDVAPILYGQDPVPQVTCTNADKDRMELALVRMAAERGLPVFGICRGIQLMNQIGRAHV